MTSETTKSWQCSLQTTTKYLRFMDVLASVTLALCAAMPTSWRVISKISYRDVQVMWDILFVDMFSAEWRGEAAHMVIKLIRWWREAPPFVRLLMGRYSQLDCSQGAWSTHASWTARDDFVLVINLFQCCLQIFMSHRRRQKSSPLRSILSLRLKFRRAPVGVSNHWICVPRLLTTVWLWILSFQGTNERALTEAQSRHECKVHRTLDDLWRTIFAFDRPDRL